ncbi:MAG: LPD1 domain-containing protein, partial [Paenisporosarcina sp.]|nr:LPD1 domain-containing protein [Paenisporosarcina sp.]
DKQTNNSVSYDVGEKIGGARKDLAQSRKEFLASPSIEKLENLENQDVQTAAEVIVRGTFFSWFTLEDCKERNLEPSVAKVLQLLIARIPKTSKDSPADRSQYMKACLFLSKAFQTVVTMDDFKLLDRRLMYMISIEGQCEQRHLDRIASFKESIIYEDELTNQNKLKSRIQEFEAILQTLDLAATMNIGKLGGSFYTYFTKSSSRRTVLENANQYKTWDDLLRKPDKKDGTVKQPRKPVWERALPAEPTRLGGQTVNIQTPEEFTEHFGFRGSEFGHYLGDVKGYEHLSRAAEAYTDLSVLLNIPIDAVSLKGTLAMAFGSRGSGRAMAHYEPLKRVINLTKEKGCLGVLAHEWFHAVDHYLFSVSHDFQNGQVGFLSKGNIGHQNGFINRHVQNAMEDLLDTMVNGKSVGKIDVSKVTNSYYLNASFRKAYTLAEGNLQAFMDAEIEKFDERIDRHLSSYEGTAYHEKLKANYAKKRVRFIKQEAEALAQHHEAMTGERVSYIPYTTDKTNFFVTSVLLDKGKEGKYWSSAVELTARAFESYMYEQLEKRAWTSDYLVCGIRDSVFPQGDEKLVIHAAMDKFIETIRPILQRASLRHSVEV